MKTISIYIAFSMLFHMIASAQDENHPMIDFHPAKQVLDYTPASKRMFTTDSLSIIYNYPNVLEDNMSLTPHFINDAVMLNYNLSIPYNFKHFTLIPYNQRFFQLGIGDINNLGGTLIWRTNKRFSFAGSLFLSKQYGYMFSSKHTSLGVKMVIRYQLNSQLVLDLWGQYLLNPNNDPFIKNLDTHPKTGIGLKIEYNPNKNTTLGIGAGFQESAFDNNKLNYSVEGKASVKF